MDRLSNQCLTFEKIFLVIEFLLLIFFLVTTTIEKDKGILRSLPPIDDSEVEPPIIKEKNLFTVLINRWHAL